MTQRAVKNSPPLEMLFLDQLHQEAAKARLIFLPVGMNALHSLGQISDPLGCQFEVVSMPEDMAEPARTRVMLAVVDRQALRILAVYGKTAKMRKAAHEAMAERAARGDTR